MYSFLLQLIPIIIAIFAPAISLADANRIFKENNEAVVVVVGYDYEGNLITQGSGFIIRQDGAMVTSYHVISIARNIEVKAEDKILKVDGFFWIDKENDLVILKVKADNLPVVRLGDVEKINIGEKVYVISSPRGLENTISEGILSGVREVNYRKILQITAPISEGSSGGPVFNKNGEVIGIVTSLLKGAQNINFAVPVDFTLRIFPVVAKPLADELFIPYEEFQKESEKEYIRWLAERLVITQDWSKAKIPKEKEMEVCEEVLKLNPYHITARVSCITWYCSRQKKKALEHYKILKLLDPMKAEVMRLLCDL